MVLMVLIVLIVCLVCLVSSCISIEENIIEDLQRKGFEIVDLKTLLGLSAYQ